MHIGSLSYGTVVEHEHGRTIHCGQEDKYELEEVEINTVVSWLQERGKG